MTCRPGIGRGGSVLERVATNKLWAVVTTQGGGPKGCAPSLSHLAQRQAGQPGASQSRSGMKRLPASVGGAK